MLETGLTILYAMFLWWFSTGVILYLDRLAPHTYRWSLLGATVLLAASMFALAATASGANGPSDALIAFTSAVLIWGWHEMSFLMGHVTGPRVTACPPGVRGVERFVLATQTVIYHEVAILITIAAAAFLTSGQPNQTGVETLLLLWGMRLSAKFNLFLGVPRPHGDLLPGHLAFLQTYFREKPMSPMFPLSVTAATLLTAGLIQAAISTAASPLSATGYLVLATLSGLALIEHWFLVVPLPDEALWAWAKPKEIPVSTQLTCTPAPANTPPLPA